MIHSKSILVLMFLLTVSTAICIAQDKKLKSYSKVSKKSQDDDLYSLITQAENISDTDPKAALDLFEKALSLSLKENNKSGEALVYKALGRLNYNQGLFNQSVDYYQKALQIFKSLGEKSNMLDCRKNIGLSYMGNASYQEAAEQLTLAVKEAESLDNLSEMVTVKNALGEAYEKQGKADKALDVYKQVLELEEKRKNPDGVIAANNKIGNLYLQQEKTSKAKAHYQKSQQIATEQEDTKQIAESYSNLGNTLRKEKKYEDELAVRKKSVEAKSKIKDTPALSDEYLEIGESYLEQNKSAEAVPYLEKSITLSEETGRIENKGKAYHALSEAYKKQGDLRRALENFQKYVFVKDSLLSLKEKALTSSLNFNEELTLKQKRIELLEKDMMLNEQTIKLLQEEQKFSKVLILGLTVGLFVVFASSYMIYKSSKKRRIANQVLALKSLRSQMNPHFIFNALNSVNSYISKNDERSANKYLSDFSKLMRTVMENSQHEFISLSTEISILQLYLSLEHSRFREKFDFEFNVDPEINPEQVEVPPMLIQPYIENAVWHGLRYRETKELLKVDIRPDGPYLLVTIEDNGIGRKKSQEIKTVNQKDKVSTGLKNTSSRIEVINDLYKTKIKVQIEDLDPVTQTGTKVSINITPAKILVV